MLTVRIACLIAQPAVTHIATIVQLQGTRSFKCEYNIDSPYN